MTLWDKIKLWVNKADGIIGVIVTVTAFIFAAIFFPIIVFYNFLEIDDNTLWKSTGNFVDMFLVMGFCCLPHVIFVAYLLGV